MDKYNKYISPFSERYSSKEMQYIFSEEYKFKTWRKMWIALAEAEKERLIRTILTSKSQKKEKSLCVTML